MVEEEGGEDKGILIMTHLHNSPNPPNFKFSLFSLFELFSHTTSGYLLFSTSKFAW